MPFIPAAIGGIAAAIGGAAAGAATVAGTVASAIGSVASGVLGGAAAVVGGTVSALTGGAAAPVTVGQQMGAIAAPAYYETAALGVPAATGGVGSGLTTILTGVQAGVGIYGQLAQLEIAEGMSETEKIKAQTELMEAEAKKIYAAAPPPPPVAKAASPKALPTLSTQPLSTQPVYVTPAPAAAAAASSYLIYAGLAFLAYILLKRK